jgi:hypothetical protein
MSNIAVSFASLVKSNNGFFKSEAQAKFLLAQCQEENTFVTGGAVYRNSYTLFYICDATGVVRVEKHLATSGKVEITFNRLTSEQFEAKQVAQVESNQRNADREAASNAKFQARADAFQNALNIAKAFVKQQMLATGTPEATAQRCVDMILVNQDNINSLMDDLVKSPEFVEAWTTYNKAGV